MQVRSRSVVRRGSLYRRIVASGVMVPLVALAGCDGTPSEPDPAFTWEAALVDSGAHEELSGTAAVASFSQSFEAAIALQGAEPEQSYAWWVATGTCEAPGEVVGGTESYPALETGEEGIAEVDATIASALDSDGEYHVSVGFGAEDEVEIVACGVLERK